MSSFRSKNLAMELMQFQDLAKVLLYMISETPQTLYLVLPAARNLYKAKFSGRSQA
jgi:hypothetical protein